MSLPDPGTAEALLGVPPYNPYAIHALPDFLGICGYLGLGNLLVEVYNTLPNSRVPQSRISSGLGLIGFW